MSQVFLFARGVVHGDQTMPLRGEKNDASSLYPAECKKKRYPCTATSACARPNRTSGGQAMGSSSQVEPASAERKRPLLFAA